MRTRACAVIAVLFTLAACAGDDDAGLFGGAAGGAGNQASGAGGSAGKLGSAGEGTGAKAGSSAAGGKGGDAGSEGGEAGSGGEAGQDGGSGTGGASGTAGAAGKGGAAGKAGGSGKGGAAGKAGGSAKGGAAGTASGKGGSAGDGPGGEGGTQAQGGAAGEGGATGEAGTSAAAGAGQGGSSSACEGVTCQTPPPSACANANTLITHGASGSCANGSCTYPDIPVTCGGATPFCKASAAGASCVACNTSADCPSGNACSESGTCASACAPPAEACKLGLGTQTRDGCAEALVLGRMPAANGIDFSGTTCDGTDRSNEPSLAGCFDGGPDHHFRLYMRKGESVAITLKSGEACEGGVWNPTLKIYQGTTCTNGVTMPYSTCGARALCRDTAASGTGSATTVNTTFVAKEDGWVVIVADGSTAFGDEGAYSLAVKLTCSGPTCGCL